MFSLLCHFHASPGRRTHSIVYSNSSIQAWKHVKISQIRTGVERVRRGVRPRASHPQSFSTDVTGLWCIQGQQHLFKVISPPNMLQFALFTGLILRYSGCLKHNDDLQWTDPDNWNPDSQIPRWHREIPSEPTTQKCKDIYNHKEKEEIKTNWSRQRLVVLACTDYPDPNVLCILLCAPKPSTLEKRKLQPSNIALVMSRDSRRKRNGEKESKMQQ